MITLSLTGVRYISLQTYSKCMIILPYIGILKRCDGHGLTVDSHYRRSPGYPLNLFETTSWMPQMKKPHKSSE